MAQYDRAIQSAFREVADALASRDTLGEQLRALQEQTAAERRACAWPTCATTTAWPRALDLLDAQRSLFAVQQQAVLAQLAQAQNQVLLYKALGGGWADTTTTSAR